MQVKTGKGPVALIVVMAIWSLSLCVDLPGLAVTPMLNELGKIFPHATQLEVQLLTVLPNLVIIPFVLLGGRLSRSPHKMAVIFWGLAMYLAAGILYFFAQSMTVLILLSCLLGIGCGLILPFSTGLIADVFTGKYRMKQMGVISAIGNLAVVGATYLVGFLASGGDWHLPFVVYLIPVVSLVLLPFMSKLPKSDLEDNGAEDDGGHTATAPSAAPAPASAGGKAASAATAVAKVAVSPVVVPAVDADGFSTAGQKIYKGFYVGRTCWLMFVYFFFVYATSVISYFLPYLMADLKMSTTEVGTITAIFFLAMFLVGLIINPILKTFRTTSFIISLVCLAVGFILFVISSNVIVFGIGAAIIGFGNGTAQPIIYDKATETVTSNSRSTMALALILAANYVAISVTPVVVDFFKSIFHAESSTFPFLLDCVLTCIVLVFAIIRYKGFVFGIHKQYYE